MTSEIYSTSIRATGLGFLSAVCRVGGMLMPWVIYSFFAFGPSGPFLAFFITSLISTISAFQLPKDTVGTNLD
jgi:hypothetical protein